ncbi:MAG TPA: glycosyltransferase family 4 protein [Bacteroidota bacterium]|nr:glycosyltransferase family 4 protein [Bacteroidota bacterium]
MKILHILPYVPIPVQFGGAIRIFYLLKSLAERHEVTVLAYGSDDEAKSLHAALGPNVCRIVTVPHPWTRLYRRTAQLYSLCTHHSFFHWIAHSREMQEAINETVARQPFDLIQIEFTPMGCFELGSNALKLLDAHNVEYLHYQRMASNGHTLLRSFFYYREYQKLYREELSTAARFDALLVTSEKDKEVFDRDLPGLPKFTIQNGVDPEYFHPSEQTVEPHSLVFTGMMGYVPNYDGIMHFLDRIFPLILKEVPNAKAYIVGKRPPEKLLRRASGNVIVTGHVNDVRPYVWNAAVYVVPLRMGSGTRLKVLEAFAMKKPIVTTSIGSEGIDTRHEESCLIADDPYSFAQAVLELFRNPALGCRLSENGFALMWSKYRWSVIGEELNRLYQSLVKSRSRGPILEAVFS